jgi:threonine aldolase
LQIDRASVETNLVYFDVVAAAWDPATLCAALLTHGVRMSPMGGPRSIRAVTHLDVSAADIETALGILREILQRG